jgi:hypothetical protein
LTTCEAKTPKNSVLYQVILSFSEESQYFVRRNIPVLGIEPARNVAQVAVEKGVPTITEFFGADLARGWGRRRTVARDYLRDQPVMLGTVRFGPDLAIGLSLGWGGLHIRCTLPMSLCWRHLSSNCSILAVR